MNHDISHCSGTDILVESEMIRDKEKPFVKGRIVCPKRDTCYSKTYCPYGNINGYEGTTKKVGSNSCHDCMHFISSNLEKMEVECNADKTVIRK